jgi:SAM-dependent methyltransferase
MGTGGIATYYARLGRWTRVARAFGYGGGHSTLTVHRALADPQAQGRATFTRLHDVLREQLPPLATPRVLDAGCGLGGTMLALAAAFEATCIGLTLSPTQAQAANAAAARRGLASRVRAVVQSYDDPPQGPFDLIVAIESLAHSADPKRSVAALAGVLAPGGLFVVVDDMPEVAALATKDLHAFKAGWQCPVLWSASEYKDAFSDSGLRLFKELDLTGDCRPRSRARIERLVALNRIVRRVSPSTGLQQVLDSHLGGLALERLTRDGVMRYGLLIARRPELRAS